LLESVVDLLLHPMFVKGVLAGAVVLVLGITFEGARDGEGVLRFGGLMVAVATTIVLFQAGLFGLSQVIGIALLALSGLLSTSLAIRTFLALPGAFLVIRPEAADPSSWLPWVAIVALVLAAPVVASFDIRYRETGLPLPLFGIATLGVFLTVPDTEGAMVLLGVAGPAGFLGWPRPFATLGGAGSFAVVGVYVFVAAEGASGRPASIVASIAVLGLLLIVPVAVRVRSTGWAHQLASVDALFPLVAQLLLVLLISRTGGRMTSMVGAAALSMAPLTVAAVIMLRRSPYLPD